jgi:hypothetical protein
VTPPLPGVPDAPRARPDVLLGPVVVAELPGVAKSVPGTSAVKLLGGPTQPPGSAVGLATLGAPTVPPATGAATASDSRGPALAAALAALPHPDFATLSRHLAAPPSQPTRGEPGAPDVGTAASADNPFATYAAPGGPVPAGSSLLAVLASYVLPGSGSLPISTLLLLVQLAVILAAFVAPRRGLGERVLALGRLGPRSGYRTVLARPG